MQRPIENVPLRAGAHPTRDDGVCAMEMVAWLAGEAHSDEPRCACPVLGALVRASNDAMTDAQRDRFLRPLVPLLVGTRDTAAVERVRGMLVVDFVARVLLPMRLRRERRRDEAELLAQLPTLRSADDARAALRLAQAFARHQRAALWVLQRAGEGVPPARFVAAAAQLARLQGDTAAWSAVVALVERMVAITPATVAAADAATAAAATATAG
jgi:hypothetical protein